MPICKGARLKIKRANEHISQAELSIDRLKERLAVTANINPGSGNEFIKYDFANIDDREAFENLPTIIGDAVHNLKCSLDHVWLETMNRLMPSGKWGRTKFPIYPSQNDLELALREIGIDVSCPKFFKLLVNDIQPYDGGDFALRTVHKLDIRDKHRLLIPVVNYSSIGNIYLKDKDEKRHKGGTWGTTLPLPHFVEFEQGLHIENQEAHPSM